MFNRLFTLANMPIQRFGSMLISKGQFEAYLALLREAHRDDNLDRVMCRDLISVDYRGYVYDCDFNQMLDLPLACGRRAPASSSELLDEDSPAIRSASPATATAAPPDRARAAAAR